MDEIFEERIDAKEIQKFRQLYAKEKINECLTSETQFSFAWCLVRSRESDEVKLGITLLEQLYKSSKDESEKRDYLYYVAFGYTRVKEYRKAVKFTQAILEIQPNNHQVKELQTYILKKEKKDGLIGLAVVGGAVAVAVGGIVGLGVALARK